MLLRHPRIQLLSAEEGLPHMQKEVPLCVFGEILIYFINIHLSFISLYRDH